MSAAPTLSVSQLYIYPVKSCRGVAVGALEFDSLGAVGDRRFLIVDEHGLAVTQRTHPLLASVATTLEPEYLSLYQERLGTVTVPRRSSAARTREVQVWNDVGLRADDCGSEAAEWLSTLLSRAVRLVRTGPAFVRPVRRSASDHVGFADAYPLLILTEGSLTKLNERLQSGGLAPVPMDRFRPNLVIRGADPHAEDDWSTIRIGDFVIRLTTPCARCVMITTDQLSGARHREPLHTLAQYRRDPLRSQDVNFGRNAINATKHGRITMGEVVTVQ